MVLSSLKNYPVPDNEDSFETFCMHLFARHLSCGSLQKYGRRGQRQHGVDLVGNDRDGRICAVQCKLRNADQILKEGDIRDDVAKAKQFPVKLNRLVFATTANRSQRLHELTLEITHCHRMQGLFSVEVVFKEGIDELLNIYADIRSDLLGIAYPSPDIAQANQPPAFSQAMNPPVRGGETGFHAEIDEAFSHSKAGAPELTILALEQLRTRHWDRMSDREKFRTLANIGNALKIQGKNKDAARYYFEAHHYQPNDEVARTLQALAYLIADNLSSAFDAASKLCQDYPNLARAHFVRIQSAPAEAQFEELVRDVPAGLLGDTEIAAALSHRALINGEFEVAVQYARKACEAAPDWAGAKLQLGISLLCKAQAEDRTDQAVIREAIDVLDVGAQQLSNFHTPPLALAIIFSKRAMAHWILGNTSAARQDITRAIEIAPTDAEVVHPFVEWFGRDDSAKAIRYIEGIPDASQSPGLRFSLARLLIDRDGPGDRERAIAILRNKIHELNGETLQNRVNYFALLLDVYSGLGRFQDAETLLSDAEDSLKPILLLCLRGVLALKQNDDKGAANHADEAVRLLAKSSTTEETSHVALLLYQTGRFAESLELLKRVVPRDRVVPETRLFITCANRIGDDGSIMQFCADLRKSGVIERDLVGIEFHALMGYREYSIAGEAIGQYLHRHPDDPWAIVNRSYLGIEAGRPDLVESDLSRLPPAEVVENVGLGRGVVMALLHGPHRDLAPKYAYTLLRRFPDDSEAHITLIASIFFPSVPEANISRPLVVEPGAAVCFRREGDEADSWIIIEDEETPIPSLTRNEYPSAHPVVLALIGKRPGDTFQVSEGPYQWQGKLCSVENKLVWRAQQSANTFQELFPDREFIARHNVNLEEQDPKKMLGRIAEQLEARAKMVTAAVRTYQDNPLPAPTLAKVLGKSTLETMFYLAAQDDCDLRCAPPVNSEWREARTVLQSTNALVVEPTAIGTLLLLEEQSALPDLPFRLIAPQSFVDELREMIDPAGRQRGYMAMLDGRLVLDEVPQAVIDRQNETWTGLIDLINTKCEVVGGAALAELSVKDREGLKQVFPISTADAIAIAQRRCIPLWTDDLVIGEWSRSNGIARVWTQAVFQFLYEFKRLNEDSISKIIAKLCGYGYEYTSISPGTVLEAARIADWNPDKRPLSRVLARFGDDVLIPEAFCRLLCFTIRLIWRQSVLEENQRTVTLRILRELNRRKDGKQHASMLMASVDRLMGLDVLAAGRLREIISSWLENPLEQTIIMR